MSKVFMWIFAGGGMLAIFDWVVAGLLAKVDPTNAIAAQAHESPFFLVTGVVFAAIGLAIAYFCRPDHKRESTNRAAHRPTQ